ncbi:hypothetical protein [Nocardia sp. NBC_01329]|nr:hypothetical protein OG405_24360 [Nocardia sp. NBC_01329]
MSYHFSSKDEVTEQVVLELYTRADFDIDSYTAELAAMVDRATRKNP